MLPSMPSTARNATEDLRIPPGSRCSLEAAAEISTPDRVDIKRPSDFVILNFCRTFERSHRKNALVLSKRAI